jgi:hypothetical protein
VPVVLAGLTVAGESSPPGSSSVSTRPVDSSHAQYQEAGVDGAAMLYLAPSPVRAWNIAHPERGGSQVSPRHGQGGAQA